MVTIPSIFFSLMKPITLKHRDTMLVLKCLQDVTYIQCFSQINIILSLLFVIFPMKDI